MIYNQATLINADYQSHLRYPRMPKKERAAIFLPYAALNGFEEKIQYVLKQHGN
ncbi:hypothetical protein ACLHIM_02785 [Ligilactobacillus sp. LYQ112]|uniref:hypothetical protein n=1 Tax=unclassified Ligilactobacillus TaxID=2767920 RepID=UPI003851B9A6